MHLGDLLPDFALGAPQRSGGLVMFPLLLAGAEPSGWRTTDEALATGEAVVTETGLDGHVPELALDNRGAWPLFLLDGEQLVGAKQNRILNLSILAPARTRLTIPVSCVEQGRWTWRTRAFAPSADALFASARADKARHVNRSLRTSGSRRANQSAVWDMVAAKSQEVGAFSETGAMDAAYLRRDDSLSRITAELAPIPDQVGAVFACAGRVLGADAFSDPVLFAKLFPKLARSYAMDAAGPVANDSVVDVQGFLARCQAAPAEPFPAVGLGEDWRVDTADLAGGALLAEGRLVHLAVFPR